MLYAIYDTSDSHHEDSLAVLLHALDGRWGAVFTTNYIVLETTLLLAARRGPATARALPDLIVGSGIKEQIVDGALHAEALKLFQRERSLSLTDAVTTLLLQSLRIENLLTFDLRSFAKHSGLVKGNGYWGLLSEGERKAARVRLQGAR